MDFVRGLCAWTLCVDFVRGMVYSLSIKAVSSAVEHLPYKQMATGSNPVPPSENPTARSPGIFLSCVSIFEARSPRTKSTLQELKWTSCKLWKVKTM